MKLVCPRNPEHKLFTVTAHITETWIVGDSCEYWGTLQGPGDVTHKPDRDDLYSCFTCGAEAIKEE